MSEEELHIEESKQKVAILRKQLFTMTPPGEDANAAIHMMGESQSKFHQMKSRYESVDSKDTT